MPYQEKKTVTVRNINKRNDQFYLNSYLVEVCCSELTDQFKGADWRWMQASSNRGNSRYIGEARISSLLSLDLSQGFQTDRSCDILIYRISATLTINHGQSILSKAYQSVIRTVQSRSKIKFTTH